MLEQQIARYRHSGDHNILVEIYRPFQPKVFRMCMHYLKNAQDSEDAVVDIFLELRDKLRQHQVENFPAWLHTVVRNHCLKKLRKKTRLWTVDESLLPDLVESAYERDHIDELLERLTPAIDDLDEKQRWCIVLFYLHGKSYREIEQEMGYSAMEVKSAIQNGKVKLKKILMK